jgi:hypothetical protein
MAKVLQYYTLKEIYMEAWTMNIKGFIVNIDHSINGKKFMKPISFVPHY